MNSKGNVLIYAPRDMIWKFLADADFVAKCTPGVKEFVESLELAPVDREMVKVHGETR